ncbi:alpha/beta hydrolase-fold protein [Flavitalea flava]
MRGVRFQLIVLSLFAGLVSLSKCGFAQEVYPFKKGLIAVTEPRYGREALYKDPLAWQLYKDSLKTPVDGGLFGLNAVGKPILWKELDADSLNRFRRRGAGFGAEGSYLYLSYFSDKARPALLHILGDGGLFFNGVPHAGDPYSSGWLYIPVSLKKGLNELYIRVGGQVTASLIFGNKDVQLNCEDPTIPVIETGAAGNDSLQGAVVVVNTSSKSLKNYRISALVEGKTLVTAIPVVLPMSTRKVSFIFNGSGIRSKGRFDCLLSLMDPDKTLDEKKLSLEAAGTGESYSVTFKSGIDGSLQYYAVTPQAQAPGTNGEAVRIMNPGTEAAPPGTVFAAGTAPGNKIPDNKIMVSGKSPAAQGASLFLSVHGAGVEAIGQARAYHSKDWGTLVAATNRRPRGFNWEDWGRLDALEVLALAEKRFAPDPQRIYLTGHSMGGHGTWFLGAAYPEKWAAIGACSGYPTLKDYGSHDGVVPDSSQSPIEQILLRASNQSDVIKLATNYKPLGVYVLHGDSDKVVPVKYARQMRKVLAEFHTDLSYHEVPGAEHWYGNQSVDWDPLFDFFKWHTRKPDSLVTHIDFMTASPGISASYYWASIQQQVHPLVYSRMQLTRDLKMRKITGNTENIRLLRLSLADFGPGTIIKIGLDDLSQLAYTTVSAEDSLFLLREQDAWKIVKRPEADQKGPQRYGTLKDAFTNHMVFVYGTIGNEKENQWSLNKARYDAETWYYRGNGAVDIISDKEYSQTAYPGRNVILYGNASTNASWKLLLPTCPIQVERNKVRAGDRVWEGDSLGVYFVWPLRNSPIGSVAVIGGSGLKGMEAANANQYFAGASGFPDFMVFGLDMLQTGERGGGLKIAGFFDNDWKLTKAEMEEN